jgi:hypothetical protein
LGIVPLGKTLSAVVEEREKRSKIVLLGSEKPTTVGVERKGVREKIDVYHEASF